MDLRLPGRFLLLYSTGYTPSGNPAVAGFPFFRKTVERFTGAGSSSGTGVPPADQHLLVLRRQGESMPTFEQQQFDRAIPTVLTSLEHCEQCAAHCTDHISATLARCIKLCHACAESCVFCMKALRAGCRSGQRKPARCAPISAIPVRWSARNSVRMRSCGTVPRLAANVPRLAAASLLYKA
jgi:hypothetical protein